MAGMVAIPQSMMGTVLNEIQIQAALIRLNPGFHFDWATKFNMWHPYQNGKQGVYFNGKHLCSMDRGQIPQAPIWSTKTEGCRVPASDLSYAEAVDPMKSEEVEFKSDGREVPTGYYFVIRQVKDRLLWIGWQALLRKVVLRNIEGVTAETLGKELGVTIDVTKDVEELEVAENRTHLYDATGRELSL